MGREDKGINTNGRRKGMRTFEGRELEEECRWGEEGGRGQERRRGGQEGSRRGGGGCSTVGVAEDNWTDGRSASDNTRTLTTPGPLLETGATSSPRNLAHWCLKERLIGLRFVFICFVLFCLVFQVLF